jgi:predicted short-subunit dehydrogenase-like oxidoreductase (DUF2520 family)
MLRYAARVRAKGKRQAKKNITSKSPSIAFVGAGKLASFLVPELAAAGYKIAEIVGRKEAKSMRRARALARRVGARASTLDAATLEADMLWLAVPDGKIRRVAESLARRAKSCGAESRGQSGSRSRKKGASSLEAGLPSRRSSRKETMVAAMPRFAFHSSGALGSGELGVFRKAGVSVASVHPLMTFVAGTSPSLRGVPFAVEGDREAVSAARSLVRKLGGESFVFPVRRKAAYHAWATMTSPLLLAYLVTLENGAREAGLGPAEARRMSLPILRQTIENYAKLGPANSFSGPFVRGDAVTVKKHLTLLNRNAQIRGVYVALARVALNRLPVRNRRKLVGLVAD